jgi:hypothetical protein
LLPRFPHDKAQHRRSRRRADSQADPRTESILILRAAIRLEAAVLLDEKRVLSCLFAPRRLVDISRLPLPGVTRGDGNLHVGALTTMEELAADPTVTERLRGRLSRRYRPIGSRLSTLADARRCAANIAWMSYLKHPYVVALDI